MNCSLANRSSILSISFCSFADLFREALPLGSKIDHIRQGQRHRRLAEHELRRPLRRRIGESDVAQPCHALDEALIAFRAGLRFLIGAGHREGEQ